MFEWLANQVDVIIREERSLRSFGFIFFLVGCSNNLSLFLSSLSLSLSFTMGKNGGFLTPKAIANRIKAKGLLKLKFYCQVCEKQCRDENGFKCHTMSESHQRQMLLVAENPGRFVHNYSDMFKKDFLSLLSRAHGTKRVFANQVYQEYIADRNHIHMNATRWNSLSEFVKYLGREGICHVEEAENGWYITWIDNSPKALARQVKCFLYSGWNMDADWFVLFRLLSKKWNDNNETLKNVTNNCYRNK